MSYGLDGRVVIVTGAGSGIGLSTVKKLCAEGAHVFAGDLDPAAAKGAVESKGGKAIEADVTKDGATLLRDAAIEAYGKIDGLVACAGIGVPRKGLADLREEDMLRTFDVNVLGVVRACQAVVPHMVERGSGSLVAVASDFGRMPEPAFYDYCMSKSAVLSFMKSLSIEFGPKGIRANSVSPGATLTGLWEKPGGAIDIFTELFNVSREDVPKHFATVYKNFALQRIGRPEEIAEVNLFLISDRSSFVTGSDYCVNGGSVPVF